MNEVKAIEELNFLKEKLFNGIFKDRLECIDVAINALEKQIPKKPIKVEVVKMTNADKIRSMSDEDLAINMMCPNENGLGQIECDKSDSCNCYDCILKWLQSDVN